MRDTNADWLIFIPEGWRELGQKMIDECEALDPEFEIFDLKEKYGVMRCYANISTKPIDEIIDKYEHISARTCCRCGKPATKISHGWICPFCDDCTDEMHTYSPIDN